MATKDERPNLLSKMAMFVRNPTKDWSELGRPEPEQEVGYDKQALKAMNISNTIEVKERRRLADNASIQEIKGKLVKENDKLRDKLTEDGIK